MGGLAKMEMEIRPRWMWWILMKLRNKGS